jgi:hypothetical protein
MKAGRRTSYRLPPKNQRRGCIKQHKLARKKKTKKKKLDGGSKEV